LTPAALEKLATEGYDPAYGARPLKRVIQHRLLDPLSLDLLDGMFKEGQTIRADVRDGEIVFST
jgi:ATP-dependent Clp protease ATP-binding subunit ClpB